MLLTRHCRLPRLMRHWSAAWKLKDPAFLRHHAKLSRGACEEPSGSTCDFKCPPLYSSSPVWEKMLQGVGEFAPPDKPRPLAYQVQVEKTPVCIEKAAKPHGGGLLSDASIQY